MLFFLLLFYAIRFFYQEVIPILDADGSHNMKNIFESICKEMNEYTKMIPLTFLLGFYVSNVVSRYVLLTSSKILQMVATIRMPRLAGGPSLRVMYGCCWL